MKTRRTRKRDWRASAPLLLLAPMSRFAPSSTLRALAAWLACLAAAWADDAGAPDVERGLPLVRTFLARAYRGHHQIWAGVEATDGTVLFGHQDGLAEYDGLNWRTLEVPGASFIRAMTTDAAGTVWLAGVNELGRLQRGADGRLGFESLRARLPAALGDLGNIWCVHALPDGVWFQSNAAVLRWSGEKFEVWPMHEKQTVLSYRFGERLLVARLAGWFVPRAGGGWEQIGDAELGKILPRFVLADGRGAWLVGTGAQGLRRFDGTRLTPVATEVDDWLKTKKLYGARRLPDGRLVLLSLQGGALVLSPELRAEMLLDEAAGLPSDTVISALPDRFGALWLGTDRGLARVELASPVTWFGAPHGLGRGGAETIHRIDGQLVLGGQRGMLALAPAANPTARPQFHPTLEGPDRFNVFQSFPDGVLAGGVTGLHWIHDGRSEPVRNAEGTLSGVREIVPSRFRPGLFLVTHLNGIAWLRREGARWELGTNWTDPHGEMRTPIEDASGAAWLTLPGGGVLRLRLPADLAQPLQIERFGAEAGLPGGRVWIDEIGGAPLFHLPQGFFRFDDATRRFRRETRYGPALASGAIFARVLVPDERGGFWVAAEPDATSQLRVFHVREGRVETLPLPNAEEIGTLNFLRSETRAGREILWMGAQYSLLRVDVTAWRAQPPPALGATRLREVQAGARRLDPAGPAPQIEASANTLRFVFGTPALAGEPNVLHATRLRGFAAGAETVSAAGERVFTNLPAGDYAFEVRGRSADARWSEPARYAFRVLAPWWKTAWAWLGYAALAGTATWGIVRRRTRTLERERTRLENVVAARTAELAQKNRELERLNALEQDEKLAARLAEEKARLELLRYQLNPHFLFNSLNSIRALVYANPDAAGEMVTRLAEFCRWTLTRGSDETTTVADEAEMVRTYLDIEKVRWQDALIATVEIDDAARGERLPQFLLLPLIENAIKYGGRTSPGTLGVRVGVRREGDELVCEVANTGAWIEPATTPPPTSTHIGLENLRQRLARHYGRAWSLDIRHGEGRVLVQLRLRRGLAAEKTRAPAADPFPAS